MILIIKMYIIICLQIVCEETVDRMFIADGIDNDCDGRIDEERCDGQGN